MSVTVPDRYEELSELSDTTLKKVSSHDAVIDQLRNCNKEHRQEVQEKLEEHLRVIRSFERQFQVSPATASFLGREKNTDESQGEIYKNYHNNNLIIMFMRTIKND